MIMLVTQIANGQITLDGNHPFAGKDLLFHVVVVGVCDATAQDLQTGEDVDLAGPLTYQ